MRRLIPAGLTALALAACGSTSTEPCVATIRPSETTVAPGDQVAFTSSLDGRPRGQTLWTSTGGFVDSVGNYTAPTAVGDYTVTVADSKDAKCTATATVHVVPSDAGAPDAGVDAGP